MSCLILLTGFVTHVRRFKEYGNVGWTWLYLQRLRTLYSAEVFQAAQIMLLANIGKIIPKLFCKVLLYGVELDSSTGKKSGVFKTGCLVVWFLEAKW